MNGYLNYFIEANIGLVLFLTAYTLLLRNETDFKIKRYFLLIGIFTSLTFPLLHIQYGGTVHSNTKSCDSFLSLAGIYNYRVMELLVRKPLRRICQGWMVLLPGALCCRITLLFITVHRSAIQPAADDQKF